MELGLTTLPNTAKTPADAALAMAVAYVRLTEPPFGEQPSKPDVPCLERFEDYVLGFCDGVPKSPGWASYYTGVPSYTIRALAQHWDVQGGPIEALGSEDELCEMVTLAEALQAEPLPHPAALTGDPADGLVRGTVYDYETDEVIEGATVTVKRLPSAGVAKVAEPGEGHITVLTNDFGDFRVDGPVKGAYLVSIAKPGYTPRQYGPFEGTDGAELMGFPMFLE